MEIQENSDLPCLTISSQPSINNIQRESQLAVSLATLRFPTPARYWKMYNTLKKRFNAKLITGTLTNTVHLRMNAGTVFSYASLFCKLLCNKKPTIIDVNALTSARLRINSKTVVDFRTPLAYELKWLGHDLFSSIAQLNEGKLKDVGLVIAANEHMAEYCRTIGARKILEIPNYPSINFKHTIGSKEWKKISNVPENVRIVLFTGGVRLREIYGIDLLLESWRIIEDSGSSAILVILGDDSIDYIKKTVFELNLKRVMLPGRVNSKDVANWINCADLCVAPRTPGFSSSYYNYKDSTKISEYAAFRKPIVATCYAPSKQYLLVDSNSSAFAEGIMKGLDGHISSSQPHFWEENEPLLLQSLENHWLNNSMSRI